MALGNIRLFENDQFGAIGSRRYQTQANTTVINPGEPVSRALGSNYVTAMATNKPVAGTDYLVGIASGPKVSTQTTTADGIVDVIPLTPNQIWGIAPKVAATWGIGTGTAVVQATYNALVGTRVLIDLTSGVYTLLAADSANNGCIVENLDITKVPNTVAFSFRAQINSNQ